VEGSKPGWVVPSIERVSVIWGSSPLVGSIVNGPGPGMLKEMASAPGFALAAVIASRSVPGPESAVLVIT
jgi:hypothetical protein